MLVLSELTRARALARGEEGSCWLDGLGDTLVELEREWEVVAGPPLGGSSESYVAAAKTCSGEDVVVKIAVPGNPLCGNERRTLEAARGRGYVRLLAYDETRQALLLERLGPSLAELGFPAAGEIEALCATFGQAWEVPADPGLPTGAEKARWLSQFVGTTWDELDGPCSERVVAQAVTFAAA
jgi:streptomycin 6-kinase